MLEKRLYFQGQDDKGNIFVEALRFAPGHEKTAGIKVSELEPALRDYISKLKPVPGKLFVLVNALGAGEYWSSNLNADWFGEAVLRNEDPENGYKTFLKARINRHHKNKDPADSFGDVVVAAYNPRMHRVELLLRIDRERAKALGHQDLIDELDAGGHPACSMGMRTPWDICSICKHQSKTQNDRCTHILNEKNVVYPDGRLVCMINPVFKAFDISFVIIGADNTSFAIAKVANLQPSSATVFPGPTRGKLHTAPNGRYLQAKDYGPTEGNQLTWDWLRSRAQTAHLEQAIRERRAPPTLTAKTAAQKTSAQKLSELIKRVPIMGALQDREPSLPTGVLNRLGSLPLPQALAAPTALGMVLQPREFQRIILVRAGSGGLADSLDQRGLTFPCSCGGHEHQPISDYGGQDVLPQILRLLLPFLASRSAFSPLLEPRLSSIRSLSLQKVGHVASGEVPALDQISRAYDTYRSQLPEKFAGYAVKVASQDPEVLATMFPDELDEALAGLRPKMAGFTGPEKLTLLGVLPLTYLLTQAFKKDGEGGVVQFVKDHPLVTGSFLVGLLGAMARR